MILCYTEYTIYNNEFSLCQTLSNFLKRVILFLSLFPYLSFILYPLNVVPILINPQKQPVMKSLVAVYWKAQCYLSFNVFLGISVYSETLPSFGLHVIPTSQLLLSIAGRFLFSEDPLNVVVESDSSQCPFSSYSTLLRGCHPTCRTSVLHSGQSLNLTVQTGGFPELWYVFLGICQIFLLGYPKDITK